MRTRAAVAVLAVVLATSGSAMAEPPPAAPAEVTVGPEAGGNVIDTLDRGAVRTAYKTRYASKLATPMGWTGSVNGCRPGTTSAGFRNATLSAVNFFRGMVGLPAVVFDPALNTKAQAAVLIQDANNALSHTPSAGARCATPAGRAASIKSNLAMGVAGPRAVGLYMSDPGSGNTVAGHRRWIVYPPQRRMGSGSTNSGGNQKWDALYVLHNASWQRPANEPDWVSWPSPGFLPYPLLSPRFTLGGNVPANAFASATVHVSRNGTALPATVVSRNGRNQRFGDPTIVFDVNLNTVARGPNMTDTNLRIEVDGIDLGGGNIVDRTWTTTVFSTSRATSNPANDAFASAQELSSPTDTAWGRNVGATAQAGEPQHHGIAGGHSVWYRFTAVANGQVTIDTNGSAFDTLLAVYTGSPVGSLTPVTSDDDTTGTASQVTFAATAGTTYRIAVDGKAGATGRITLNWTLPT